MLGVVCCTGGACLTRKLLTASTSLLHLLHLDTRMRGAQQTTFGLCALNLYLLSLSSVTGFVKV